MTMTPEEALAKGREFAVSFGNHAPADDMARVALDTAAWMLENADPQPAEDTRDPGPLGPKREVACADTPTDKATVQGGVSAVHGPSVRLSVASGTTGGGLVILTTADARRFAAGILDAADEADGGNGPLLFGLADLPSPA
ncbi:hypothetical protein GA0070616_4625 [Micromonospora nigra]|uniref:Uncharacterized protein n=1 Tax=Micromonospora nigra TaxID=145857 RepID=A0A1C6SUY1_9ACTN|nr:hypothetical protein [Micromonospora nigra]SCL33063.1 hypothetical protein GA0070616_4625 [Micromonospora nigra]